MSIPTEQAKPTAIFKENTARRKAAFNRMDKLVTIIYETKLRELGLNGLYNFEKCL